MAAVTVTAKAEAESISLTVHNSGPPIPSPILGKIFNSMTRGYAKQTESNNLGLGLYISEQIITAHAGTIIVTSAENTGTSFTCHIPKK